MSERPKVTLISCGGTIASTAGPGGGASPTLDVGEMARGVPGVAEAAELDTRAARLVASPHMGFGDLLELAAAVRDAVAAGSDGVVITQGTDTIEEIAFGLDLLHEGDAPVVVTGAMRNASLAGADGPANLLAAVRTAAAPRARGLGVLVVFNDEIHAARFVRKTHTQSTATFRSGAAGPIGWLAEADVRIALRPAGRHHLTVPGDAPVPPVALLRLGLGDDGRLMEHLAPAGYAGVVLEGFGGGHVTAEVAAPGRIEALVGAMPVVLASRSGSGEVLRATYRFAGSEIDLAERGVITAGALDGAKARVLLSLLLAGGAGREAVRRTFASVAPLSA